MVVEHAQFTIPYAAEELTLDQGGRLSRKYQRGDERCMAQSAVLKTAYETGRWWLKSKVTAATGALESKKLPLRSPDGDIVHNPVAYFLDLVAARGSQSETARGRIPDMIRYRYAWLRRGPRVRTEFGPGPEGPWSDPPANLAAVWWRDHYTVWLTGGSWREKLDAVELRSPGQEIVTDLLLSKVEQLQETGWEVFAVRDNSYLLRQAVED